MTMPAGLLASMMGASGASLSSLIDIPCGVCLAGGNPEPHQGRTLVGGTIVCGEYHAAVAAQAVGLRGGERVDNLPATTDLINSTGVGA